MDLSLRNKIVKIKRINFSLFKIIVILGFILIPQIVVGNDITIESPITATSIPVLVERITNYVFWIGMVLAPLMILVGAFYFLTAAGNPEKIATGKKIIFWTIIGLAIILFGRGIISVINNQLKIK